MEAGKMIRDWLKSEGHGQDLEQDPSGSEVSCPASALRARSG